MQSHSKRQPQSYLTITSQFLNYNLINYDIQGTLSFQIYDLIKYDVYDIVPKLRSAIVSTFFPRQDEYQSFDGSRYASDGNIRQSVRIRSRTDYLESRSDRTNKIRDGCTAIKARLHLLFTTAFFTQCRGSQTFSMATPKIDFENLGTLNKSCDPMYKTLYF